METKRELSGQNYRIFIGPYNEMISSLTKKGLSSLNIEDLMSKKIESIKTKNANAMDLFKI